MDVGGDAPNRHFDEIVVNRKINGRLTASVSTPGGLE
jgi:hypothetical protein